MTRFLNREFAASKPKVRSALSAKVFCASVLALSLSACTSVPQDGVIATDVTGSFSQMWSSVFTGELRRAPQPQYSFGSQYVYGGNDATLNTPRLMKRVSAQSVYNQSPPRRYHAANNFVHNPGSFSPNSVSHSRITPQQRPVPHPQPIVEMPKIETPRHVMLPEKDIMASEMKVSPKQGFGSRLRSMFKLPSHNKKADKALRSYESFASLEPPALTPAPRPARSQPVLSRAPEPTPEPQAIAEYTPPSAPLTNPAQAISQDIGDSLTYVKIGGGSKISEWKACEEKAGAYYKQTAAGFIVEPKFDSCMREIGYMPESEAEAVLSAQAEQIASSANAASQ